MLSRLEDVELQGKVAFIRVDFNVPLTPEGGVLDDTRIRAALPTIRHAIEQGARVVLASHLGRPNGPDPDLSLAPAGDVLAKHLGQPVVFADDCVGDGVQKNIRDLKEGEVLLLENLRFYPAEKANEESFARALAEKIDVYIGDAFGAAHRAHASTAGMVRFVRDKAAGFLLRREVETIRGIMETPERPFVAVIGGSKVTDKVTVLDSLVKKADVILIGGAMAYTFLAAIGRKVGNSRVEMDKISVAEHLIRSAAARKVALVLPVDHIVADRFDEDARDECVSEIREGTMGLDIGPQTAAAYADRIMMAKTVFWNGPMGVFEWKRFAAGTRRVAEAMAACSGTTVVGGGDSVAALVESGLQDKVSHISTGGGASLELIEGKRLPGVEALEA